MGASSIFDRGRALAAKPPWMRMPDLDALLTAIRRCRVCVEAPRGKPLPHEPRPVLRASATARLAVCGQAPGTRVHQSGTPFTDPSGDRLRDWMGVTPEEFYDDRRVAIVLHCHPVAGMPEVEGDHVRGAAIVLDNQDASGGRCGHGAPCQSEKREARSVKRGASPRCHPDRAPQARVEGSAPSGRVTCRSLHFAPALRVLRSG